jgi:hypothetical protein
MQVHDLVGVMGERGFWGGLGIVWERGLCVGVGWGEGKEVCYF